MPTPADTRLRSLESLTNFGLFKNFAWDANTLGGFERYNLIYGWNYSGKTTLSRVFQAIEEGTIHGDFVGGSFKFRTGDGSEVSLARGGPYPTIRVFNREFVLKNFRGGSDMTGANVIAVIGESNQALKDRMELLQRRVNKISEYKTRLEDRKATIQGSIDSGATAQARLVNQIVGGPYTRVHLNQAISALPKYYTPLPLVPAELEAEKERFRRAGDFAEVDFFVLDHRSFIRSIRKIRSALCEVATNTALETLRNNRELERWVDTGLSVNAPNSPCGFCGSMVSEERWNELKGHFSEAFAALQSKLHGFDKIFKSLEFDPPSTHEVTLFPELRGEFRVAFENVESCLAEAKSALAIVDGLVQEKLGNLEVSVPWKPELVAAKNLRKALRELNGVLKRHNEKVAGADEVKRQARENICQHFAVEYWRDCEVLKKNYQIRLIANRATRCASTTTKIIGQIAGVRQAIRDASIGAQTLNENLAALLPNDNIVVVKLNETDFEIQRNGRAARNMSEGERTAVAFSYFLTKLAEGGNLLEETIVVLDDPISSLDENHIYAVHSICQNRLSEAKQLFVLTHNSSFFGLTKDWMKKLNPGFFMTERKQDSAQEWYTEIVPLPRMLRKFKSNYQYTYYCLKILDENPNPQFEALVNVPNMIRSLLEAYLGFVFPETGGLDDKLPRIVSCTTTCGEILKFSNENSHAHSLTQATQSPTFIVHSKKIIRDVLGAIAIHNPEHVASLEAEFLNEAGRLP